jgi:hypothetical protein
MNLHRCLAALYLLLALSGCAQVATEQEQATPEDAGRHFRATWFRLKQTDLISGKGQFR